LPPAEKKGVFDLGTPISIPTGQEEREETMYRVYLDIYRLKPSKISDSYEIEEKVYEGYAADTRQKEDTELSVYTRLIETLINKLPSHESLTPLTTEEVSTPSVTDEGISPGSIPSSPQ